MESLSIVEDPELNLKVTDLGLIYSVEISSNHVEVEMTLTSPGCPVAVSYTHLTLPTSG